MKPTLDTYSGLQDAYDFFNRVLFDDELPQCLITYQRHKNTYGYYLPKSFVNSDKEQTDEIAMNPRYFLTRTEDDVLSTLVHEMVHLKQHHFGKAGRGRYHNRQWADWMLDIGLIPSDTGEEGGKQTGDSMSHYIEPNGRFAQAYQDIKEQGFELIWKDRNADGISEYIEKGGDIVELTDIIELTEDESDEKPKSTREKYSCPSCGNNAWGKPSMNIICGDCNVSFELQ